ncbi:Hypothetical predicted protein [Paramuricea clavata]|uniref:Uncharacterized protein n=1 Tax=Paramuricea clavata TaxID=317549 RepID=A0A6S7I6L1_PARCT|nr:Hypothetical predicted protein [Paramuricea clavata]
MWNGWVSKQSLLKAAKRVGVTATGLNVNFMQKDKFEQAEGILDGNHTNEVPATSHAYVLSPQNIWKNSALYWKSKCMSAQAFIEESHERSLQLCCKSKPPIFKRQGWASRQHSDEVFETKGPLEVIPKGATQFLVPCYENVKSQFELVKNIDRTCLVEDEFY